MRQLSTAIAVILLIGLSQATAQNSNTGSQPATGQKANQPVGAGEKIPPHQQPRATNVPPTTTDQSPEDRELDRKLKAICRGC